MDDDLNTGPDDWHSFELDVVRLGSSAGGRCGVAIMLDMLTEGQRAVVQRMLGSKMVTTAGLHRALVKRLGEENTPKDHTIARHRRGTCSCDRAGDEDEGSDTDGEDAGGGDLLTGWAGQ